MGMELCTTGERRKMHRGFECGNTKKKDHLKDMCVCGIILNCILKLEWDDVDWTDLAQDSGKWRNLVNTVLNLTFLQNAGNF